MSTYVEQVDATTLRFERLLPGPIERVWQFITDSSKRRLWLAGGDYDLTVGGPMELVFRNDELSPRADDPPPEKYSDLPAVMEFAGTITRCEPSHAFAHTWRDGDMESEVEYALTEIGERVLLTLTHSRLTDTNELSGAMSGWHTHVDILEDLLSGREPSPFWKIHNAVEALYDARLAR